MSNQLGQKDNRPHFGLAQCTLTQLEELVVFAQMRELQHNICRPEASRPQAKLAEIERDVLAAWLGANERNERGYGGKGNLVRDDVMRQQVVEMLQRIVRQHGPALETFNGADFAGGRWVSLQGNKPLEDGQEA